MNKYGSQVQIVVLEKDVDIEDLGWKESQWIETLCTFKEKHAKGLNMTTGGRGTIGLKYSEERRAAISVKSTGRVHSPETRAKISAAKQKNPHKYTEEQLKKMSEAKRGGRLTEEHVAKIKASTKKAYENPEVRAKISASSSKTWAEPGRREQAKKKVRRCRKCGLESTAMGMGRHLYYSGHLRWDPIE
jgi:hypothetical protein